MTRRDDDQEKMMAFLGGKRKTVRTIWARQKARDDDDASKTESAVGRRHEDDGEGDAEALDCTTKGGDDGEAEGRARGGSRSH